LLPLYIIIFGFISLIIVGIWYDKIIPPIFNALSKLFSFISQKAKKKGLYSNDETSEESSATIKDDPIDDVIMHLAGQSTSNTNTINNLIWFAVSLFLFYKLGLFGNSAYNIWLIIVVVLIHEAGHYLSMRAFGYLDVKIFFIPLFGAPTSGIPTNQTALKNTIVSLSGPMPGIIIGTILGLIYFETKNDLLLQPARMFLLINAFNLLPLFPLDGGRVFETLFSCKTQWLEIIFKTISGLLLIALLIVMGYFFLIVIAFGFLFSVLITDIPLSIIVKEIHSTKPTNNSLCSKQIPYKYIKMIYELVRKNLVMDQPPRAMACNIQYVWQRLCARTPSAIATSGIVLVYLFSLTSSIAFIFIFETFLRDLTK